MSTAQNEPPEPAATENRHSPAGMGGAEPHVWTADQVWSLGLRTDLPTAASVLGIGRTKAYDLARRGEFPVPVLRVGGTYVVPTAPLLRLFGVDDHPPNTNGG